ncbi:MAG: hypothetical protein AAGK04_04875 [Planctomycetota bacterium]
MSETSPTRHGPPLTRRIAIGLSAGLLIASAGVLAIVLMLIAERHGPRYDVTATASHKLSPRTDRLVQQLEGEYELVISADFANVQPWVRRQLAELLARLDERSESLTVTTIDIASAEGQVAFAQLRARLAEREADVLGATNATLASVARVLEALPPNLDAFGARLDSLASMAEEGQPLQATIASWRPALEAQARAMGQARERVIGLLASHSEAANLVSLEDAKRVANRALAAVERDLGAIARALDVISRDDAFDPTLRDSARPLATAASAQRDQLAQFRDALDQLQTPDAARVERVLQQGEAALVIGPPDRAVTAIDIAGLLSPSALAQAMGAQQTDLRQRAEDLIASALASIDRPDRPVVVLVHAEASRFVGQADVFTLLLQRLSLRGIDLVEWAAVLEDEPPSLAEVDPSGLRPVVYVLLGTDASASTRAAEGAERDTTGVERAASLARVARRLIERGDPVLVSLIPSPLASFGERDPQLDALALLGLEATTDTPLLRDVMAPNAPAGRVTDPTLTVRAAPGEHPLLGAIAGLPTRFDWPIALSWPDQGQRSITPLIGADADGRTWRERDWLDYWRTPPASRQLSTSPPAFDAETEVRDGPWVIAAGVEHRIDGRPSRAVVVGSNTWFTDGVTAPAVNIDGRLAPLHPGNIELFESSVLWLAGQLDQLSQSARARAVPLIRPLDPGYLRGVRWGVIAGLPLLVLGVGLVWRTVRG